MGKSKVKQLHTNVKEEDNKVSSEGSIDRESIEDTPFTLVTLDGYSFGAMGDYRLTEKSNDKEAVRKELNKITWNRIVQIVMILDEVKEKLKNKK